MQQLAAETNYSETTFVTPVAENDGGYRVRIFTPAREIAFAGHPILGTAWVLRHHVAPESSGPLRLNLSIGQIPVSLEFSADGREVAWFIAPPVSLEATCPRERIAPALGISPEDVKLAASQWEQGNEVRRPSLVMMRARMVGGSREVRVGGQVIPTVQGVLS